jgi:hypothetical protein
MKTEEKRELVPTSLLLPRAVHSRVKLVAGIKHVRMADLIETGIQMALASERFRLSEDDRRGIFGE